MLHNQIDGLLSAIAQRPAEKTRRPEPEPGAGQAPKLLLQLGGGSSVDFKIDMVGDSTMRVSYFDISTSHAIETRPRDGLHADE